MRRTINPKRPAIIAYLLAHREEKHKHIAARFEVRAAYVNGIAMAIGVRKYKSRHDSMILLKCGREDCERQFLITPAEDERRRQQQIKKGRLPSETRLFCSRSCGRFGRNASYRIRRQYGWSDEQYEWEKRLGREGLQMNRGTSNKLFYGWEENCQPRDGYSHRT